MIESLDPRKGYKYHKVRKSFQDFWVKRNCHKGQEEEN